MDLSAFRLNHYLAPEFETVEKNRITDVIEEYYEKKIRLTVCFIKRKPAQVSFSKN